MLLELEVEVAVDGAAGRLAVAVEPRACRQALAREVMRGGSRPIAQLHPFAFDGALGIATVTLAESRFPARSRA